MVRRIHTLALRVVPRPRFQVYVHIPPNQKIQELEQTIKTLKESMAALTLWRESLLDDGR